MATYVTICMGCLYEQYFVKQARANAAKQSHVRINPAHDVRVARVRQAGRTSFQGEQNGSPLCFGLDAGRLVPADTD
jgi:hypothetical protein